MARAFLDTNVLLRHLLGDDPGQSSRATVFLERVERRELEVQLADTVVFETVFTLQRQYRLPAAHTPAIARSRTPSLKRPHTPRWFPAAEQAARPLAIPPDGT
jgi:predicted nucleic acid-binding protein